MSPKKSQTDDEVFDPNVRIVRPSGRSFQIRYNCPVSKRQVRISVGSRDEEKAEKKKVEIELRLLYGIEVTTKKAEPGPNMSLEAFRALYSKECGDLLRPSSAMHADSRLRIAIEIATEILKLRSLGEFAKPFYLNKLRHELREGTNSRQKMRSEHTVRGYMKSVLAALNWAHYMEILKEKPQYRMPRIEQDEAMKGRPITNSEFERMLSKVSSVVGEIEALSWIHLLRGLWESALRLSEIMDVTWDRGDCIRPIWRHGEHPVLSIPASKQKNKKNQSIPLLPGFECLLLETPVAERKGYVFNPMPLSTKEGRSPNRLSSEWVGKIITKIGKEAEVLVDDADETTGRKEKYASAHDLRRSCAQRLLDAQVEPILISRIMRHSSWDTTRKHYAPGNTQNEAYAIRRALEADARNRSQMTEGGATET